MAEDYYATLGVSKGAKKEEIRRAYKKLAREYHPDVKPDDAAAARKFKEIQEAYAVLGDEKKRQQYDQYGRVFGSGGPGGGGGPNPFGGAGGSFDMEDLFGGLFGGGGGGNPFGGGGFGQTQQRRPRAQNGQDIRAEITVPFHVAIKGGEHEITVTRGSERDRLSVKVPAGVSDGQMIRLSGQGQPGHHGGKSGNLMVVIKVASHPWFKREGNNLVVEVPVTPAEAALGAKVEVPTLDEGELLLTVPAGTSSGARLRLRGKGITDARTGKQGDELVVVKVVLPAELSEEQVNLYQQLAELEDGSPRDGLWV
ncbi:MAG: DnaJ C-terminal domain-containing protein [Planctomycetaceae bacterium]